MSSVTIEYGEEGPKHDPYGWTEITVTRGLSTVTLHEGLDRWLRTPTGETWGHYDEADGMLIERLFELYAGISISAARRAYDKYRSKCRECGCRETKSVAGYPGETFELCVQCGAAVDYHFNESAII